jgi:hypothetical protein
MHPLSSVMHMKLFPVAQNSNSFASFAQSLNEGHPGHVHLDLRSATALSLSFAGIIFIASICCWNVSIKRPLSENECSYPLILLIHYYENRRGRQVPVRRPAIFEERCDIDTVVLAGTLLKAARTPDFSGCHESFSPSRWNLSITSCSEMKGGYWGAQSWRGGWRPYIPFPFRVSIS